MAVRIRIESLSDREGCGAGVNAVVARYRLAASGRRGTTKVAEKAPEPDEVTVAGSVVCELR